MAPPGSAAWLQSQALNQEASLSHLTRRMNQHDASREEPGSGCLESWAQAWLPHDLAVWPWPDSLGFHQASSKASSTFRGFRSQYCATNLEITQFLFSILLFYITPLINIHCRIVRKSRGKKGEISGAPVSSLGYTFLEYFPNINVYQSGIR